MSSSETSIRTGRLATRSIRVAVLIAVPARGGTGNETAVAVDPAAGLVFSVGVGDAGPPEVMTPSVSTTFTPAR